MPLSPVIRIEASDGGDLVGQRDHARCIAGSRAISGAVVVGDGRQHRGDQVGVGRQRDVFLGAGADGA